MKVLLTGATGFIGPYVARHLIANRHEVRALLHATFDSNAIESAFGIIPSHVADKLDYL